MAIFDTIGLEVSNGDTSDETDINDLLSRLIISLNTTVEGRLAFLEGNQSYASDWAIADSGTLVIDNTTGSTISGYSARAWSIEGMHWASNDQGIFVITADAVVTALYSSKAYAEESKAWASGVGGVDTRADGVTTITRSSKEYNEDAAANVVLTNADVVLTHADVVLTGADVVLTNADVISTGLDVAATNADVVSTGLDVIAAAGYASDASDSADDAAASVVDAVLKTSATGQAIIPAGTTLEADIPAAGHLRFNTDEGKFLGYDGLEWAAFGGGGGGLDWTSPVKTEDFVAEDGKGYAVDTSSGVVRCILPSGESGASVAIKDYAQTFGTYHCLIVPDTGDKIEGVEDSLKVDTRGAYATLVHTDAIKGWLVVSASAQNPVNQPVVGAYTTGNIYGGELVYVDADTVNINPVSCMDDSTEVAMAIAGTTVVDMVGNAINTIYNFFAVRYDGGTYGVEYDTDVDGATLPATVTHKRWIGFVLTGSSGDVIEFIQCSDKLVFTYSRSIRVALTVTGYTFVDLSSYMPVSRVCGFLPGYRATAAGTSTFISFNGTDNFDYVLCPPPTEPDYAYTSEWLPYDGSFYVAKGGSNEAAIYLVGVQLKR